MKISQKLFFSLFLILHASIFLQASQQPNPQEIATFLTQLERAQTTFNTPEERSTQEQQEQIQDFFEEQFGRQAQPQEIAAVSSHMQIQATERIIQEILRRMQNRDAEQARRVNQSLARINEMHGILTQVLEVTPASPTSSISRATSPTILPSDSDDDNCNSRRFRQR